MYGILTHAHYQVCNPQKKGQMTSGQNAQATWVCLQQVSLDINLYRGLIPEHLVIQVSCCLTENITSPDRIRLPFVKSMRKGFGGRQMTELAMWSSQGKGDWSLSAQYPTVCRVLLGQYFRNVQEDNE